MSRLWLVGAAVLAASCAHRGESSAPAPAAAAAAPSPGAAWRDEILYFVVLDRFADGDASNNAGADPAAKGAFHGGDLKGLTAQLDELADLGVTALWITPVVKNIDGFVTGAGFPDWGYHGYWADDFHRLDPRFGTEADLRAFVDAAHARGLKVLLDVVYNHAGYGSRYLRLPETRDWLRSPDRGDCGQDELTSCLAGLPDFKTERPEIARYLLDAQLGWAKRSGVDGFRLDTLKHIDHPFWQEHRRRVRADLSPSFFLLGEVWGGDPVVLDPWFKNDEIDAGFDFAFQGTTVAFVSGRGRAVAYDHFLRSRDKVRPGYLLAHFLSSHDVPGALHQFIEGGGGVAEFKVAATLQFAVQGMPVVYYGEEVARRGGEWPFNRSDMPWGERDVRPGKGQPRDEALRAWYRKLIQVRKAHPALRRGVHQTLHAEGDLYVFARRDPESKDVVVIAVNRGKTPGRVSLTPPPEWGNAAVEDLLSDAALPRTGMLELTVPGMSAVMLGTP